MMGDRNMMKFRQQSPSDADPVVLLSHSANCPSCVELRSPSRPPRHRVLGYHSSHARENKPITNQRDGFLRNG